MGDAMGARTGVEAASVPGQKKFPNGWLAATPTKRDVRAYSFRRDGKAGAGWAGLQQHMHMTAQGGAERGSRWAKPLPPPMNHL